MILLTMSALERVPGKVVAVHNFGGGDILDVTLEGRKGVLIPFTQAAVPQVSIADIIRWLADTDRLT